jgi:hypothetical protein
MKVTVNITSAPKGVLVDVAQSYPLTAPGFEGRNVYVNLGQFANGTTTEIDDIVVTQFGCEASDVVIGEEEGKSLKKTVPTPTEDENA